MLACLAAAFRCLALRGRGGLAAAASAPLTGVAASRPVGWLAATLATGSERSLRGQAAQMLQRTLLAASQAVSWEEYWKAGHV